MPDSTLSPEVRRQAVHWLVEMQSDDVSDDTRARLQQWLQIDPAHRQAWQSIAAFSSKLQSLSSPLAHATLAAPSAQPQRRHVLKGLGVVLLTGGVVWTVADRMAWRAWVADHRTGVGERASLTLPDGTLVELNTGTSINVRFSGTERLLRVMTGEVLVTTAQDPELASTGVARPFFVQTELGRIRPMGTRFAVRWVDADSAQVAVFEGAVEIAPSHAASPPRTLNAGQQTRYTERSVDTIGPADEQSTAWTEGMIVAQNMPLAAFVAELARYRPGRLVCDPAVAQLKVSGTYPLADTDRILSMLAATQPLEVRYLTRYWVTLKPRA